VPLNKNLKTAILIFANSSQEEAKHKSIAQDGTLFDVLTATTLKTVKNSQLPYFHFTEKHQIGVTFGERFSNAIQAVFDKGYEHVIAIGNDSPQLKVSHLLEAHSQLQSKKIVLGPTTDGGFYLMGLHKSQFEASVFKSLAWQTSNLAKQLYRLVSKQNVKIVLLQRLFDIDTAQDIKSMLAFSFQIPEKLLILLLNLLDLQKEIDNTTCSVYNSNYSVKLHNKGSPTLLQS
jgi:glycosyltransferase A (GT-A) superfamily protein (DUF2064 family)